VQIEQARRGIDVANDRLRVSQEARRLAQENDDLTRKSFQEGRGTSLELITAAAALREADIDLVLREFDVVQAKVSAVLAVSTCSY
jgi:outer membrane protein TolC